MLDLSKLNPPQREAVSTIQGPLLVLAGAGSGKTRVIVHRIAYMIQQGIAPNHILAVTFTNKAASEMRERVGELVGRQNSKLLTVSTFHAFGLEVLRHHAGRLGYPRRFAIADASDQAALIKRVMRESKIDDRRFDSRRVLALVSRAKCAGLAPEPKPEGMGDDYDLVTAAVFPRYQLGLKAQGTVDFDDLILLPIVLLRDHPEVREQLIDRYRYLLVDEYQDTNRSQLELLILLAGERKNVCAVGDDDQSIYSWRGAEVDNILSFDRHFPGVKEVRLEQNYRSSQSILDAANAVIARNEARKPKRLWTARGMGEPVKVVLCPNDDEEGRFIGRETRKLLEEGRKPSDVAVLYRTNLQARTVEEAYRADSIPYEVVGGQEFFDRKEIKDLVAYLKACNNPNDEVSLLRIVNTPPRGIGDMTMERLVARSKELNVLIPAAMRRAAEFPELPAGAARKIGDFMDMLERYRERFERGEAIDKVSSDLVDEVGLKEAARLSVQSAAAGSRKVAAVDGFIQSIASYAQREGGASLDGLLKRLALDAREEDTAPDGSFVSMMSLHAAKGLEWPCVFLCGMEEDLLPHSGMQGEPPNIDEERRLAYVGITRAREVLYLTRAAERIKRGKPTPRTQSRFLDDIPAELTQVIDHTALPTAQVGESERSFFSDLRSRLRTRP